MIYWPCAPEFNPTSWKPSAVTTEVTLLPTLTTGLVKADPDSAEGLGIYTILGTDGNVTLAPKCGPILRSRVEG